MAGLLSRGLLAGGSPCSAAPAAVLRRRPSAALRRCERLRGGAHLRGGAGPSRQLRLTRGRLPAPRQRPPTRRRRRPTWLRRPTPVRAATRRRPSTWRRRPFCGAGSSAAMRRQVPRWRLALLGGAGGFAGAPARRGGARALPPALLSAGVRARPQEVLNHRHQTCAPGRVARRSGNPTAANFGALIGERRPGTPYRRSFGERCGVTP